MRVTFATRESEFVEYGPYAGSFIWTETSKRTKPFMRAAVEEARKKFPTILKDAMTRAAKDRAPVGTFNV